MVPNREIYEFIGQMAAKGDAIDQITLGDRLKSAGKLDQVGGYAYLHTLMEAVPSAANVDYYVQIVHEKHLLRRIVKVCQDAVSEALEAPQDVLKLLDGVEQRILAIRPVVRRETDIRALIEEATMLFDRKALSGDSITGLTTGLLDLDRLTDGLHKAELIIVAAYPSCGKTALACGMAFTNALAGVPVAILSAEMRPVQLVIRALCSEARVNFQKLTTHDMMKLPAHNAKLARSSIHIEAVQGATIQQVVAIARRLYQKHAIRLVVVDYIQLLDGTGDNKEQRVSSIALGLKALAMELACPVIGLSQLNDEGKLRDSRAIGQHADSVWMLQNDGQWQAQVQPSIIHVEKCRDGQTGEAKLTFFKTFTKFENRAADIPAGANQKEI
jgi:replicative DNA helicase